MPNHDPPTRVCARFLAGVCNSSQCKFAHGQLNPTVQGRTHPERFELAVSEAPHAVRAPFDSGEFRKQILAPSDVSTDVGSALALQSCAATSAISTRSGSTAAAVRARTHQLCSWDINLSVEATPGPGRQLPEPATYRRMFSQRSTEKLIAKSRPRNVWGLGGRRETAEDPDDPGRHRYNNDCEHELSPSVESNGPADLTWALTWGKFSCAVKSPLKTTFDKKLPAQHIPSIASLKAATNRVPARHLPSTASLMAPIHRRSSKEHIYANSAEGKEASRAKKTISIKGEEGEEREEDERQAFKGEEEEGEPKDICSRAISNEQCGFEQVSLPPPILEPHLFSAESIRFKILLKRLGACA